MSKNNKEGKKERVLIFMYCLIYLIAWLPILIMRIILKIDDTIQLPDSLVIIFLCCGTSSGFLDSIVYAFSTNNKPSKKTRK